MKQKTKIKKINRNAFLFIGHTQKYKLNFSIK